MKEKSTKIFMSIRYQKKVLNTFVVYGQANFHSAFRAGKKYYTQVFLEACKYVAKEKRCLNILLRIQKLLLMNMIKQVLTKKILTKKIWMRKILRKESNCDFTTVEKIDSNTCRTL